MRINKREKIIFMLVSILVLMGVGYAYLNTNLNIIGSANLSKATWDIHFENVQVTNGSVTTVEQAPTIDSSKTKVTYEVTLNTLGDYYEFSVDAKNAGTIDGMIESISSKLNGTEITTLPNYLEYYVTYSDGLEIENNHILKANSKETYIVHIGYKSDLAATDLPSTDQNLTLSFSVTYKQADDDSEEVPRGKFIYADGDSVYLDEEMPEDFTYFNTAEEALSSIHAFTDNESINFYLKYRVKNNIIKEGYVEFIINNDMANNNPNVTPGTYTLRGISLYETDENEASVCKAEYYDSSNDSCINPYYDNNKNTLLNAFGSDNCEIGDDGINCNISNTYYAYANIDGRVGASIEKTDEYYSIFGCTVTEDGDSFCGNDGF